MRWAMTVKRIFKELNVVESSWGIIRTLHEFWRSGPNYCRYLCATWKSVISLHFLSSNLNNLCLSNIFLPIKIYNIIVDIYQWGETSSYRIKDGHVTRESVTSLHMLSRRSTIQSAFKFGFTEANSKPQVKLVWLSWNISSKSSPWKFDVF